MSLLPCSHVIFSSCHQVVYICQPNILQKGKWSILVMQLKQLKSCVSVSEQSGSCENWGPKSVCVICLWVILHVCGWYYTLAHLYLMYLFLFYVSFNNQSFKIWTLFSCENLTYPPQICSTKEVIDTRNSLMLSLDIKVCFHCLLLNVTSYTEV